MKISLASDHAGFRYKELIKKYLQEKGIEVIDHGAYSNESSDYPDFIKPAAFDVVEKRAEKGIGVCGSGIGVSITANRIKGIRATLAITPDMAEISVRHNDSNFLALGERFTDEEEIPKIIDAWLNARFEGGRHQRRVDKIDS